MPDASFGWNAAKWAWENRGEILASLKKVLEWFRSDPGRGILVIGPGGVGKTTLARLLSGDFDWLLDEPWRYDHNYGIQEFALRDGPNTQVVVPPGQADRRASTWPAVEQQLASGAYRGLILVNADGYHSLPGQSYRAHRLYRTGMRTPQFLAAHVTECRAEEVRVLTRVAASAVAAPGKLWLLSVVTKEDLWWPDRNRVAGRYSAGEYAALVRATAAAKNERDFRHELVPVSLVIGPFVSGEAEVLKKNVAGYSHQQQVESVRRLLEAVPALGEWESS